MWVSILQKNLSYVQEFLWEFAKYLIHYMNVNKFIRIMIVYNAVNK